MHSTRRRNNAHAILEIYLFKCATFPSAGDIPLVVACIPRMLSGLCGCDKAHNLQK